MTTEEQACRRVIFRIWRIMEIPGAAPFPTDAPLVEMLHALEVEVCRVSNALNQKMDQSMERIREINHAR